ncbi:MAG: flagellar M-ring protein FliF C-terminal domain-containing protein [Candidatus Neomarinimicrobiota bacterium]|nr:flagellar M-ring protein FliF C-terminal domain-containing protein [Candidatus Neomarinimicrobiota bacterium]
MSKGIKHSKPALGMLLAASLAIGQGGVSYLSQKLLVENTIKDRIQDALSKIIDSHKYVVNVSVELEIMDEVEEQITVLSPRRQVQKQAISPAEETAQVLLEMQAQMMEESEAEKNQYSIGLPIPGFEVDISERKTAKKSPPKPRPMTPETMRPMDETPQDVEHADPGVDKVLRSKRPARAEIRKMELSLILQEGAAPELIENIRQLTMAASKFDRSRGDKLTIMTASFKERRDKRSAEQIMLKNIAEKIDILEEKRIAENTDWRTDIENYRADEEKRRETDKKFFEDQLTQMEEQAKLQAYEQEKKDMMLRDSMKMANLNNEISALRDLLTVSKIEDSTKKESRQSKLDSSRFAVLDNELQGLRQMLLRSMLQDSVEAQKQAQMEIEKELSAREKEKAKRDSLLAEKIAALDAVQGDLDALQVEMESGLDSSTWIMIILGILSTLMLIALVFVLLKNKSGPPMPPYMYGPPPRPRPRRKPPVKKKKAVAKKKVEPKKDDKKEKETPVTEKPNEETAKETEAPPPVTATAGEPSEASVPVEDDPNVVRSEIDDIRKSVVSMSVGQPDRTTTIVKEWLEQPAPAPPESEATAESGGDGGGEESGEE